MLYETVLSAAGTFCSKFDSKWTLATYLRPKPLLVYGSAVHEVFGGGDIEWVAFERLIALHERRERNFLLLGTCKKEEAEAGREPGSERDGDVQLVLGHSVRSRSRSGNESKKHSQTTTKIIKKISRRGCPEPARSH